MFYKQHLKYALIILLVMLPSMSKASETLPEAEGSIEKSIVYTGTARKEPNAPFMLSTLLAKKKAVAYIDLLPGKEILKPIGVPVNLWVKNVFSYFLGKADIITKVQDKKRTTVTLKVHIPIKRILEYKHRNILFRRGLVLIGSSEFEENVNEEIKEQLSLRGFTVFKRKVSEILWSRQEKTYILDGKAYSAFELASPYFSDNVVITKISVGKKKRLTQGYLFPTHCVVTFMSINGKLVEQKTIDYSLRGKNYESALAGGEFKKNFIKPIKAYVEGWLKKSAKRNKRKISIRIVYKQAAPDDLVYSDKIKERFQKLVTNLPYMLDTPVFSQQKDNAVITSGESPLSLVTRIDKNPIFNVVSWGDNQVVVSPKR